MELSKRQQTILTEYSEKLLALWDKAAAGKKELENIKREMKGLCKYFELDYFLAISSNGVRSIRFLDRDYKLIYMVEKAPC